MSRHEITTLKFGSITGFAGYLRDTPPARGAYTAAKDNLANQDWDLSLGYDGALQMGLGGGYWPDGAAMMTDALAITDRLTATSKKPHITRHIEGGAVCVGAALSGAPRTMFKRAKRPKQDKPILTFGVSMGLVYDIPANARVNQGAAILSAISKLESQGYQCELVAVWRAGDDNNNALSEWFNLEVTIKKPGQRFNAAGAAFMLAHPASQRRLGFRALETLPSHVSHTRTGYLDNRLTRNYTKSMSADFDVYTDNLTRDVARQCETPAKAVKYIAKRVNDMLGGIKTALDK